MSEEDKIQAKEYKVLREKVKVNYDDLKSLGKERVDFRNSGRFQTRITDIKDLDYLSFRSKSKLKGAKFDEMIVNIEEFLSLLAASREFKPNDIQKANYLAFRDSIISNPETVKLLNQLPNRKGSSIGPQLKEFISRVSDNEVEGFLKLTYMGEEEFEKEFSNYEYLWTSIKKSVYSHATYEGLYDPNSHRREYQ